VDALQPPRRPHDPLHEAGLPRRSVEADDHQFSQVKVLLRLLHLHV
jgi:hypothetical protein